MNPNEEYQIIKKNQENIKEKVGRLLMHKELLERLIEDCKKEFESQIVMPKVTRNLTTLSKQQLEVDVTPIGMATSKQLEARYKFYHYSNELADILTDIDTSTMLFHEYNEHLKQHYERSARKVTDEMIYGELQKAQALKNLSPEENETLKGIVKEMPKRLAGNQQIRLELFEALQNLILQHG